MIKVNKYLTNKVIARGVISDWLTRSLAAAWTNESARIKADRFFWTEPGIFLRIKKKKKLIDRFIQGREIIVQVRKYSRNVFLLSSPTIWHVFVSMDPVGGI